MAKYGLDFLDEACFVELVRVTALRFRTAINLEEFNRNIVDPIKVGFDSRIYGRTVEQAVEDEVLRQIDKSNQNALGAFHQKVFLSAGRGWEVPKQGFDVQNVEKNIFAEIKNKHNTMNSSASQRTYTRMQSQLLQNDQAVCMLVEVIARQSQDRPWVVTIDGQRYEHNRIRRVSMDRFYALVFGDCLAFKKMVTALPIILEDVVREGGLSIRSTVLEELQQGGQDIEKSLLQLAFSSYYGFTEGREGGGR